MIDRLKVMEKRYLEINTLLSDPEVVMDIKRVTALSKEQKQLEKPVMLYKEQQKLEASIPDLRK